jgi:hypothetical protein
LGQRKNDLPEGGKRQPQQKDKLESVVEGEPVDNADEALKDTIDQLAWVGSSPSRKRNLT